VVKAKDPGVVLRDLVSKL